MADSIVFHKHIALAAGALHLLWPDGCVVVTLATYLPVWRFGVPDRRHVGADSARWTLFCDFSPAERPMRLVHDTPEHFCRIAGFLPFIDHAYMRSSASAFATVMRRLQDLQPWSVVSRPRSR